jgi:hypothetical protein
MACLNSCQDNSHAAYIKRIAGHPALSNTRPLIRSFIEGPLSNLPLAVTFIPALPADRLSEDVWPRISSLTFMLFRASFNAACSSKVVRERRSVRQDKS